MRPSRALWQFLIGFVVRVSSGMGLIKLFLMSAKISLQDSERFCSELCIFQDELLWAVRKPLLEPENARNAESKGVLMLYAPNGKNPQRVFRIFIIGLLETVTEADEHIFGSWNRKQKSQDHSMWENQQDIGHTWAWIFPSVLFGRSMHLKTCKSSAPCYLDIL